MIPAIVDKLLDELLARIGYLLYLPGDTAIDLLIRNAPALADRLGIGRDDIGGVISLSVSIGAWIVIVIFIGLIVSAIRDFDRALTAYLSSRYGEAKRLLRIQRRKLTSWIGLLRHRRRLKSPGLDVAEVELGKLEAAVLRCHAGVDELHVMAADEVARRLKLSVQQVRKALRSLLEQHLIERSFGTDEGREGHRITRAGQIYLIEH
jgi:DNA-binding MarR family transcriptional regulator